MDTIQTKEHPENETIEQKKDSVSYSVKDKNPLAEVNDTTKETAKEYEPAVVDAADVGKGKTSEILGLNDLIKITDEDKEAFIKSVISGERYTGYAYLYGGRIRVKFRSRSVEETDAIMSYIHRNGILGKFITQSDIKDSMLAALLVAQVAELGDVSYTEMKSPLKYVETPTGVEDPAWLADLEMWKKKPEHLVCAIGDALIEFESKYWKMIQESRNENFWNPGESTGK